MQNYICYFLGNFSFMAKVLLKLNEKVSGQLREPVVNGATLALSCWVTSRSISARYGLKKEHR